MPLNIDTDYLKQRLKRVLEIPSPSSYTDQITRDCAEELQRLGVDFELTRRGAVRARLPGKKEMPARAIVAHLDTLGAQVKALKSNGRLQVVPIGHWSARFAEGARCTIYTDHKALRGGILPLKASGHTFNEEVDTQPTGWDYVELRVDEKASNADDLRELGIDIGDIIAIDPQPEFLDSGFIVSRHLDDKAGVAVLFAALKALCKCDTQPEVDTYFIFTVSEEVGQGASSVLMPHVASMITIDNGTTAPGQNSAEFGVTIAMADQTGPFDWHLTRKLVKLCQQHGIDYQKDVFRYYRSDSASALDAGADIRTALLTFGIDASHGYERIHTHALTSLARLLVAYTLSPVEISRDAKDIGGLKGFTRQP
ncbi:osmoprotectant NAGGN system M42 family peptidase [Pseudomarimonas arenosa]|uniref:Osmoprotectant NAGGN system M42 family peptidase n=1 Tax=Pseudomarimonas arenosa TaxID=2774145 RepID=A0AAW3ZSD3_9GAMM|nr:osmoprotectant NAGGN system M42 family peptidase [Pseudomarimonas arenosa]MBD8527407.1 osmoprotectant NAGGN system M42 family peptidase [Pseudomarimonas arenosa]